MQIQVILNQAFFVHFQKKLSPKNSAFWKNSDKNQEKTENWAQKTETTGGLM